MKIWECDKLRIESLSGDESKKYFEDFARLRIEIFREYPYLYDGDIETEKMHLEKYLYVSKSRIFVLFDTDKIVGMLTSLPLEYEDSDIVSPLKESGLEVVKSFYLGDMVLEKEYRGKKLFPIFFKAAKGYAQAQGYNTLSLMSIISASGDWGRPQGFRDVAGLCQKIGFHKIDNVSIELKWPSISKCGELKEHKLEFFRMDL